MTKGAIYIVVDKGLQSIQKTIDNHYKPAIVSASSIKKYIPDLNITLYTNIDIEVEGSGCFDNIVKLEFTESREVWINKWNIMLNSPYDITLHMDADTYVCDDISEMFELMNHFDLAAPLSVHYISGIVDGVPDCFPELGGGVILWKKNEKTKKFIQDVLVFLKQKRKKYSDEPFMRKVLFEGDLRFAVLPWEYNCVVCHPGYLFSKAKITHGRIDLIKNSEIINKYKGKRIFSGERLFKLSFPYGIRKKLLSVSEVTKYGHSCFMKEIDKNIILNIPEGETL